MSRNLIVFFLTLVFPLLTLAQPCTTSDATGCKCLDTVSTNCDLLPDLTISWYATENYMGGPTEYSQSGNGANDGRLRLSSSTPNIGRGPLTVGSVSMFVCGVDTYTVDPGTCPGGGAPKQLVRQRIYHKTANAMSSWIRWAGSMTYHSSHGHMHVDDWAIFTLRLEDPLEPDTLKWPIVGNGAKIGFCLMDYGTCSYYNGHCRDSNNVVLLNGDFLNYGLGGGNYNCSPVEQGISVGYTDIYNETLDGMWIDIPAGTCNGDYWIVAEVDPHDYFLESNDDNNWMAVPYTLTKQVPAGSGTAEISVAGPTNLCVGETVTLTANTGSTYEWSNGDSTQSITVDSAGSYYVIVNSPCGIDTSTTVSVTVSVAAIAPATVDDSVCVSGSLTLEAIGSGPFFWFDALSGGSMVGTGPTFSTPTITVTTNYYVEMHDSIPGSSYDLGPVDNTIGTNANQTNTTRYLIFDAIQPFLLKSVWVDANGGGNRVIEYRDNTGTVVDSRTVYIPDGTSRVTLNFNIAVGSAWRLGTGNIPNMSRNDSGVLYPYEIAGVASITGSSSTSSYYYYFYDWDIETESRVCSSPRGTAVANVFALPNVGFSGLDSSYSIVDPAVSLAGIPPGGIFSGPGVSGNTFDPSVAGIGGPYTITYTYTDAKGCENSEDQFTTVVTAVGILDVIGSVYKPLIYPNPTEGTFNLSFELQNGQTVKLQLMNLAGETVLLQDLGVVKGMFNQLINARHLATGVYLAKVQVGEQIYYDKILFR